MIELNVWAARIGIALGLVTGSVQGLFFASEGWLGGYGSWSRRLRLGHISFFGVAFLNLTYANANYLLGDTQPAPLPSAPLIAGAVLMPTICYLAAWRKALRHLFFLSVLSLLGAAGLFISGGLLS